MKESRQVFSVEFGVGAGGKMARELGKNTGSEF
jgi:hypothetical protein